MGNQWKKIYVTERVSKRTGAVRYYASAYFGGVGHCKTFDTRAEADEFLEPFRKATVPERKQRDSDFWEFRPTPANQCSICGGEATTWEMRPTGWDFGRMKPWKMQKWGYCAPCWERHCRICGTAEPTAIAV